MVAETKQQRTVLSKQNLLGEFRSLLPLMIKIYVPVLFILLIIGLQDQIPASHLMRDPLALAKAPFYFGAISNIGVLFWCSTAAIGFFSLAILKQFSKTREFQQFLLLSSCLTSLLLLDDLFLFHESFFPNYLKIPENRVLGGYAVLFLLYLVKSIKTILKTEFTLLILACVFFGLSIVVDEIRLGGAYVILEDGFKLLGIVSWMTYFVRVCAIQLKVAIAKIISLNSQTSSIINE